MSNDEDQTALHRKYRPKTLDEIIGHEDAVNYLNNAIKNKKYPNALLFTGPPSVGKTTMARCFAATMSKLPEIKGSYGDFTEVNAGETRTIDEMRQIIQQAKLMPRSMPKRFVVIDEAQNLLGLQASVNALLKPLEEPARSTIWILSSMEPEKFRSSTHGQALMKRCTHIQLKKHTAEDLYAQSVRIIKGEGSKIFNKESVQEVIKHCDSEMRTLANLLQLIIGTAPDDEKLTPEIVQNLVAKNFTSVDDVEVVAVRFLLAAYAGNHSSMLKEVLNASEDIFSFFMKAQSLLRTAMLMVPLNGGQDRHPKVWPNESVRHLYKHLLRMSKENKNRKNIDLQLLHLFHVSVTRIRRNVATTMFDMDDLVTFAGDCAYAHDTLYRDK